MSHKCCQNVAQIKCLSYICGVNVQPKNSDMAVKVKFYLRVEKKEQKDSTIYFRLSNGRLLDVRAKTPFSVSPKYWDDKVGMIKSYAIVSKGSDKAYLQMVASGLTDIRTALIEGVISGYILNADTAKNVIERLIKKNADADVPSDVIGYLAHKINQMANGTARKQGADYKKNTVKAWKSFQKLFISFVEAECSYTLEWQDIDRKFFEKFVMYMQRKEYLVKSVNKYLITFKAMINAAEEDGLHNGVGLKSFFYKIKEAPDTKAAHIYLTDAEIEAFFSMPLIIGSLEDKVRDSFVFGCYTALRVSDYTRVNSDAFHQTEAGTTVIRLKQTKTAKEVVIPILNENALKIARKYGFNLPQTSDVIINRYIKFIAERLSETVPTLASMEKTVLTMREREMEAKGIKIFPRNEQGVPLKARWELVCTHTARRSAITNLYKRGTLDFFEIMAVSGHTTEKSLKTYLCMAADEVADRILRKIS